MNTDIRLSIGFWQNPKVRKLQRRAGLEGVRSLQILWLWAAANKPSGDLSGMDAEDVELAADWNGEEGAFVDVLSRLGFLDGEEGDFSLHDWLEHNGWAAGDTSRADAGRFSRMKTVLPDVAQVLEARGVTQISKSDYEGLKEAKTRQATLDRLLSAPQPLPEGTSKAPQGTLKAPSRSPQGAPPTPIPIPAPIPASQEHAHDGSRDLTAPAGSHGVCVPPAPLSGEDIADRQDGAQAERRRGDYEFSLLRQAYDSARQEGELSGRLEFLALFSSPDWPGIDELLEAVRRLCAEDDQFRRGYAPGLAKFIAQRMWRMKPRAPAGQERESGLTPEEQEGRRKLEEIRARQKAEKAERAQAQARKGKARTKAWTDTFSTPL